MCPEIQIDDFSNFYSLFTVKVRWYQPFKKVEKNVPLSLKERNFFLIKLESKIFFKKTDFKDEFFFSTNLFLLKKTRILMTISFEVKKKKKKKKYKKIASENYW